MPTSGVVDASAGSVVWDLGPLLDGHPIDELLDEAEAAATALAVRRGMVAELDAGGLVAFMAELATIRTLIGRAEAYAGLRFAADTSDPEHGALLQMVSER